MYIDTILGPDERVLYETDLSAVTYLPYFFLMFAGLAAGAFLWWIDFAWWPVMSVSLLFPVIPWLQIQASEFAVTNRRVVMKTGVLSRNVFEMRLAKIESVDLSQSFFGRILNYGTVIVRGTGDTKKAFTMIESPVKFRSIIDRAIHGITRQE